MSADLRNFLIGLGVAFVIFFILGMFFFGSIFMYQMGKNNTASEVVTMVEKVGVVANETKSAVVEVKNSVDQLTTATKKNTAGINELKSSVEKIPTQAQKPEVKVYVKVPTPKQDPQDQNEKLIGQIGNMVDSKLDAKLKPVYDKLENLSADQIEIKKQVKDLNTRFGYIETDVNKISGEQDRMKRMLMGEKEYMKMKEKQLQEQKNCDENLSGNK